MNILKQIEQMEKENSLAENVMQINSTEDPATDGIPIGLQM